MKRSFLHRRLSKSLGFTLIELLVVIGIIAILAGVLFPAVTAALRAAQRAKAANLANQIQTGVLNYYGEYSVYPVPGSLTAGKDFYISDGSNAGTDGADATDWTALLYALGGNVNPYNSSTTAPTATSSGTISNTRSIQFLNLKSSDCITSGTYVGGPKNPLPTSSTVNVMFNIVIDSDYDGIAGDSGSAAGKVPNFVSSTTGSIAYYSTTSGPSAGAAVWANCNGSATSTNPNFWVKSY